MAISSGRRRIIKKMTKAEEYFEVGEIFEYSPVSEQDIRVFVQVVDNEISFSSIHYCDSCDLCDLHRWCNLSGNRVKMEDGSLHSFTPNCMPHFRSDGKNVYFKEI